MVMNILFQKRQVALVRYSKLIKDVEDKPVKETRKK